MFKSPDQKESENNKNLEHKISPGPSSKEECSPTISDTPRRKYLLSRNKMDFNSRSECASSEVLLLQRDSDSLSEDASYREDDSQAQSAFQETESCPPDQCNFANASKRHRSVLLKKSDKVQSPLTSPSSNVSPQSTSPSATHRKHLSPSPSTNIRSLETKEANSETLSSLDTTLSLNVGSSPQSKSTSERSQSPLTSSRSITRRRPLSNSPSETIQSLVETSPSSNVESPQDTSRVPSPLATLHSSNVGSPRSTSPAENSRSSSAAEILSPLSNSPSETIRTLVSTSATSHVKSPQSTTSEITFFSNDIYKGVSTPQTSLKNTNSRKESLDQKTPSPQAGLTTKRLISYEESPSKRNRSVDEENTKINQHSLSLPSSDIVRSLVQSTSVNVRSPLEASPSSNDISHDLKSPAKSSQSSVATSLSTTLRRSLSPTITCETLVSTSPSPNVRSPQSTSRAQPLVATLNSSNVESPQSTSQAQPLVATFNSSNVESPDSTTPAESSRSSSATFPSTTIRPSSNSPSETVRTLVSTSPSSNVRSLQSTTSDATYFSNDIYKGVSLQTTSFKIPFEKETLNQKTPSPQAGPTTKRLISYEESSPKRNRSVDTTEENARKIQHSQPFPPSYNVRSSLAKKTFEDVPSPLETSPSSNNISPHLIQPEKSPRSSLETSSSKLNLSIINSNQPTYQPLNPSSRLLSSSLCIRERRSQAESTVQPPTSVPTLQRVLPYVVPPTTLEITKKDACCQVNLCCKNTFMKRESNFSIRNILKSTERSDGNKASFYDCKDSFNSTCKSTSKIKNNKSKESNAHECHGTVEEKLKNTTRHVPKGNISVVKKNVSSLKNPQNDIKLSRQRSPITEHIPRDPLKGNTGQHYLNTLMHKKVLFVGTKSCGKTSLILKILNKLNEYDTLCKKTMDYSFSIASDDQRPIIKITFRDIDMTNFVKIWWSNCQFDVFILCFAVNESDSFYKLVNDIHNFILRYKPSIPMMLVGLKSDLKYSTCTKTSSITAQVVDIAKKSYKNLNFICFLECSIYDNSYRELVKYILHYFQLWR